MLEPVPILSWLQWTDFDLSTGYHPAKLMTGLEGILNGENADKFHCYSGNPE